MVETVTFTPAELFAGSAPENRRPITVKSGQNLAANTVIAFDSAGKVIAHPGNITTSITQSGTTPFAVTLTPPAKLAGVLVYAVDATAGDTAGLRYADGNFFGDKLVWPVNIDGVAATNLTKQSLMSANGSELFATFSNAGEL
jgi:hypothetical protein